MCSARSFWSCRELSDISVQSHCDSTKPKPKRKGISPFKSSKPIPIEERTHVPTVKRTLNVQLNQPTESEELPREELPQSTLETQLEKGAASTPSSTLASLSEASTSSLPISSSTSTSSLPKPSSVPKPTASDSETPSISSLPYVAPSDGQGNAAMRGMVFCFLGRNFRASRTVLTGIITSQGGLVCEKLTKRVSSSLTSVRRLMNSVGDASAVLWRSRLCKIQRGR